MGLLDRLLGKKELDLTTVQDLSGFGTSATGDGLQGMVDIPKWLVDSDVPKEFPVHKGTKDGFKSLSWVYACVQLLMSSVASAKWHAVKEPSPGKIERQFGHPLEKLLMRPNKFLTQYEFFEIMIAHAYLGGNSLDAKVRAKDGTLMELWPLAPDRINPKLSEKRFVIGYEHLKDGRVVRTYNPKDVIHWMFPDPDNLAWGIAPLLAASKVIESDIKAIAWNKGAMDRRMVPDGAFTINGPGLTQKQFDAFEKKIQEKSGSGNPRGPLILGGGQDIKWHQMSLSAAEMDFINSRKFSREEIASVFRVPPPLVGILDNATLANIYTARRILWADTVIPLLEKIQQALNASLVGEYDEDTFIKYDIDHIEVILDQKIKMIEATDKLVKQGVPFNMASKYMNLGIDDVPGGDDPFKSGNTNGVGQPAGEDTETDIDDPDGTDDNTKPTAD